MARGRLISKSLGSSRRFHALLTAGGKLGEFCQILFPLLIANTDDFGRMPGDAFTVKNVVLPSSRRPEADFDRALDTIANVGLVDRYQVDERIYLQVINFDEHQPNLHKRTASKYPESPGSSGRYRTNIRESNLREFNPESNSTQNPEENPEPRLERRVSLFDQFWAQYPKKKAKDDARKAWDRRRPTPELLAIILQALELQCQSPEWQRERGRYIPNPATWLNRGQWTDEPDIAITPSAVSDQTRDNLAARDLARQRLHKGIA